MIATVKNSRIRNFHLRYLELCRIRNYPPIIKENKKNTPSVDFFGDKFRVDDWLIIMESLYFDESLQVVAIRLRKNIHYVLEQIDSERKARIHRGEQVIFTKFIFGGIVNSVSNCLQNSKNIKTLFLEGLPLKENYLIHIVKALSTNESVQSVSFARSSIGDKGCDMICNTIKYLPNIEYINFSNNQLSSDAALFISEMIKFQKIFRFTEGWKKSLRYRDIDSDSIPGLREIVINGNPNIADIGLNYITEVLKEDEWIKVIEMENCGLSDNGIQSILECLDTNKSISTFSVKNNEKTSQSMYNQIRLRAGKHEDKQDIYQQEQMEKHDFHKMEEKILNLQDQLGMEIMHRKSAEQLKEELHEKIKNYEMQILDKTSLRIPDGFILIKEETFELLKQERDNLKRKLSITKSAKRTSSTKNNLNIKKAKSETIAKQISSKNKQSKSEHGIIKNDIKKQKIRKIFIEKNIGDALSSDEKSALEVLKSGRANDHPADELGNFLGVEALKVFIQKKTPKNSTSEKITPQMIFMGKRSN